MGRVPWKILLIGAVCILGLAAIVIIAFSRSFTRAGAGITAQGEANLPSAEKSSNTNALPAIKESAKEPALSADSFISVFVSKDGAEKILIAKDSNKGLPIASITKLMTALVADGQYKPGSVITISENAVRSKGSSGVYRAGEKFLFSDALQAMLVGSHNEIANSLSDQNSAGEFVAAMNQKAAELGLLDTKFFNPTGLDPDTGDHINHSSAFDLYKLGEFIVKNKPDIFRITTTENFKLSDAAGNFVADIENTDKLLEQNIPFGIVGGKTGETPRSKQSLLLATAAPCGGNLFSVVLGSQDRFADMEKLLRYVNEAYDWNCEMQ